ncbi:MAG: NUDIX hydrolase [Candidatus Nanohaloarchaea archaeon]
MVETTRHFTATTFIVNEGKVLLHLHKKLDKWLPVGGHIDRDELPHKAAEREAREESGLEISIEGRRELSEDTDELPRPDTVLLQDINEHHQHIDSVFYVESDGDDLDPENGIEKMEWFTVRDLSESDLDEEIEKHAREAIEKFDGQ